ncbi:MAG: hypothetical protein HC881_15100 [Leptolyngbyaceae cyanobacterium SL_7_1]|nr:hypothetical protein [Leptolyngbyaceae cyanobacterium SL_7_1]
MHSTTFSVETIDGCHLGKLAIPYNQIADWLNFLTNSQYRTEIISAEQGSSSVDIYFQASEGLYLYLGMRLSRAEVAMAS